MKPTSFKVMRSNNLLQNLGFGAKKTVASIKGVIKKQGVQYANATVVLYNKSNLQPIAVRKPDQSGNYHFFGLNKDVTCFVISLDSNRQFNAVIQDNVVPK